MSQMIGKSVDRVDGRLKVTGGARYAAEFKMENLVHGVLVMSTIAKGRIRSIDTREAERAPGAIAIMTHLNAPRLPWGERKSDVDPQVGRFLRVLQEPIVHFSNQPIAVVIADTLERAEHAATLVRVTYDAQQPVTSVEAEMKRAFPPQEGSSDYKTGQEPQRPADVLRGDPQALVTNKSSSRCTPSARTLLKCGLTLKGNCA